jgi:hypothetical protein
MSLASPVRPSRESAHICSMTVSRAAWSTLPEPSRYLALIDVSV